MNEIIININEANKAQKYQDEKELFQIEAFKNVAKILKEHKVDDDKTKDITDCRFHDTIFIDGDRGVGKTAFMINIENYYKNIAKIEKPKYIFLKPVDPTLLEHTEKFLSVVLARIVEFVNDNKENFEEKYYKSLENLSKSLEAIKTLDEDIGIDEIASNKSSLKLEQYAHEFFLIVSKMFGVNAIVMLIDDVDMAFDKGFDVLEVVRKYLASPYLIPIVAGDMKLYREIVETKFMEKIDFYKDVSAYNQMKSIFEKGCFDDRQVTKSWDISKFGCDHELLIQNRQELKDKKYLVEHLVEQYLHKVFPSEYHIKLKDIFSILKSNNVTIEINGKKIPYKDLKDFEIRVINWGINQKEFTQQVFTNNTRDFAQYLYHKKEIFGKVFDETYNPDDYIEKEKSKPYSIISNRFDELIKKRIIGTDEHKKTLKLTADFYRYANDENKKRLSLLLDNDVEAFTEKGYSIYKALRGNFFLNEKSPYNKIDKEVIRSALDFPKYFTEYKSIVENLKESYFKEYFVFNLMLHNDYYTNTNTKHLFITGKFIEAFFCLLDNTIDNKSKIIINISNPIFSEISKNNYIQFNENYREEEFEDDSSVMTEKIQKYFSKETLPHNKPFITSIFLHEVLKKYINNLNIFKIGEHKNEVEDKFNDEFNKLYKEVPYFDNMKKVLYILLNSIAYFELRETPSNENIALGKNINNINKSRTYNKNIRKMIETDKETDNLTVFFYQLFRNILNNEDKSNSLFIKTFEELNDLNKLIEKKLKEYGYNPRGMTDEKKEALIDNIVSDMDKLDANMKRGILEYPRFMENIVYYVYKKKPDVKDKAMDLREQLLQGQDES